MHSPAGIQVIDAAVLFAQVGDKFLVADFTVAGIAGADLVVDVPGSDVRVASEVLDDCPVDAL